MLLTGQFSRTIDQKQRVAIPRRLREDLESGNRQALYIAPGTDRSLALYAEDAFARLAERLAQSSPTSQDVRTYNRLFYARRKGRNWIRKDAFAFRRSWLNWRDWKRKSCCWECRTTWNCGPPSDGRRIWPNDRADTTKSRRPLFAERRQRTNTCIVLRTMERRPTRNVTLAADAASARKELIVSPRARTAAPIRGHLIGAGFHLQPG